MCVCTAIQSKRKGKRGWKNHKLANTTIRRERARKLVTEFLILKQFAYDSN